MTRPTPEEIEGIRSLAGPDLECECCDNASADKLKLLAEIDALAEENKKLRSFIEEFIMGRRA